jgi:hypothetical protein
MDAPGHAKAGASSDYRQGTFRVSFSLLEHYLLMGLQVGQAINQHSEVVHQLQLAQAGPGG